MSVRQLFRTDETRHRVPPFAVLQDTARRSDPEAGREIVRVGPAADFNWGAPLPPMTMQEIAEQEPAEWETTAAPLPLTDPVALIEHAWQMAVTPLLELLAEPEPDTDWHDKLLGVEAVACREISQLSTALVASTNQSLDRVAAAAAEAQTAVEL